MSTKQIQGKPGRVAPHHWSKHVEPLFLPLYKKSVTQLQLDRNNLLPDGAGAAAGLPEVRVGKKIQNNFLGERLAELPFAPGGFHIVTGFNPFQYLQ